jgi:CheB methylesterase
MYITDSALRPAHNQSERTAESLVLSRMRPVPEGVQEPPQCSLIGKKRFRPSVSFAPFANGLHSMAPRKQSAKPGGNGASARRRRAASAAPSVTGPRSGERPAMTRLVVGLGASAGGLDAFKSFFAGMPTQSGMVFVLVQHLDPHHKSLLVELLSNHTEMPVVQAADGMAVAADHVFIIPPNAVMTIKGGTLRVSTPAPPREHRRPIDVFFASLAEDQAFEQGVYAALRRARRLDEQIVRTIAISTSGLLAQLRLLSAFFDESTNGAGRRGALLIQSIAAGIERVDAGDPAISSGTAKNTANRSRSTHSEIDGTVRREQVRINQGTRH